MRPDYTPEFAEWFWSKVDRSGGPDACWPWTGGIAVNGYGTVYYRANGKGQWCGAHRIAWELTHGDLGDGMFACHDCPDGDRRECCNPRHLFEGTATDNNHDMMAKGRWRGFGDRSNIRRGERSPMARLTEDAVREIRSRAASGESQASLAQRFGICRPHVSDIVGRKRWKHVA